MLIHTMHVAALLGIFIGACQADDDLPFQACPLLRAYYPPQDLVRSSPGISDLSKTLTKTFDELATVGSHPVYGDITPNTTSFSVVLFSGANAAVEDPLLFEYHFTAQSLQEKSDERVSVDTPFPIGTLTQVLTVYTWLVEQGDEHWNTPITKFVPELCKVKSSVKWHDVTIGSLAGHMSGLARHSNACTLGSKCDRKAFLKKVAASQPVFLSDTTPLQSDAAFQLLAFALESQRAGPRSKQSFENLIANKVFKPLGMEHTFMLSSTPEAAYFGQDLKTTTSGEPASLSAISSNHDLARLGNAILSSRQLSPATTRRWLQPIADTSNLRNGVGRPWEIYHSGAKPISPITDVFTKAGEVENYSSYFGVSPDYNVGFGLLAHDAGAVLPPDLNVYVDVLLGPLQDIAVLAAKTMGKNYIGKYSTKDIGQKSNTLALTMDNDGPGLVVDTLIVGGKDMKATVANLTHIEPEHLDFRLYPSNALKGSHGQEQYVASFQDRNATADAGTPTCITWQWVGNVDPSVPVIFVFDVAEDGSAKSISVPALNLTFDSRS